MALTVNINLNIVTVASQGKQRRIDQGKTRLIPIGKSGYLHKIYNLNGDITMSRSKR